MITGEQLTRLVDAGTTPEQLRIFAQILDESVTGLTPIECSNGVNAARQARYRERKNLTESEWNVLRLAVFQRDGYICTYCGGDTENPHCDHFIPLILGGTNDIDNLVTSCPNCNFSKSGKHPNSWSSTSTKHLQISTDVEKKNLYQRRWREKKKLSDIPKEISTDVENVEKSPIYTSLLTKEDTKEDTTKKESGKGGTRFVPTSFPPEWKNYIKQNRADLNPEETYNSFSDWWIAQPGNKGLKLDWAATWRTWVRNQKMQNQGSFFNSQKIPDPPKRNVGTL